MSSFYDQEMPFALGCLHCDKPVHTADLYCSESCRMEERFRLPGLDTISHHRSSSYYESTSTPIQSRPGSGFYLPPAINFSAYRRSSVQSTSTITSTPNLSPSSSRSSLKNELSLEAQRELMGYTHTFDGNRDAKRRLTR